MSQAVVVLAATLVIASCGRLGFEDVSSSDSGTGVAIDAQVLDASIAFDASPLATIINPQQVVQVSPGATFRLVDYDTNGSFDNGMLLVSVHAEGSDPIEAGVTFGNLPLTEVTSHADTFYAGIFILVNPPDVVSDVEVTFTTGSPSRAGITTQVIEHIDQTLPVEGISKTEYNDLPTTVNVNTMRDGEFVFSITTDNVEVEWAPTGAGQVQIAELNILAGNTSAATSFQEVLVPSAIDLGWGVSTPNTQGVHLVARFRRQYP